MTESFRALIVDDSITARMWVVTLIEKLRPGWSVVQASNAQDALEKVEADGFDAILLDINMPGMNGFELGEKLRERYPEAYISMLTANTQMTVQEKAAGFGFGFIPKPISDSKIESFIEAAEASRA